MTSTPAHHTNHICLQISAAADRRGAQWDRLLQLREPKLTRLGRNMPTQIDCKICHSGAKNVTTSAVPFINDNHKFPRYITAGISMFKPGLSSSFFFSFNGGPVPYPLPTQVMNTRMNLFWHFPIEPTQSEWANKKSIKSHFIVWTC